MTQGLGNYRIFVIASEAKQSLGILDLSLGILDLVLEILDSLSSSGLTRESLFCNEIPRSSRGMTQGLEILDFALGILEFILGILDFA